MSLPPEVRRMPTAWLHALFTRRGLLGLAVVLVTALAIAVAAAEPAGGETPLECDGGLYLTTGSTDDMQLMRVDQETGDLTPVGGGGLVANGIGHNPQDDLVYGIDHDDPHHLVQVSADGTEVDLGAAVGAPPDWALTYVGTFLPDGTYLVLGDDTSGPRGSGSATWAAIDVTVTPPQVRRTFSHPSLRNNDIQDVALNPVDGQLYAHSISRNRIVRIDPDTGAATGVGPTFAAPANAGSTFFDSFGRMWLYGSRSTPGTQDTLYRIDQVGDDGPDVVAHGPAVFNSDGASCPFSIGLDKTVDPAVACAGTTVTYAYEVRSEAIDPIPREGGTVTSADFVDQLPDDGRRFVAGTLVNPFGGDANDYGGTDRLRIDTLQIPFGQSGTIRVDVALPPDLAPGTLLNQARLEDLSGNLGAQVLSEFPGTPQLPDPTPLQVQRCSDLGVEKTAETPVAGPGDEVAYSIRVTNHGPSDAVGVDSLADSLPDGLTFAAASHGGTVSGDGTVRWPAMDLPVGAHRDVTVTATAAEDVRTATEDDGDLDNTASVQHPGDTNPANDRDDATVPVDRPDLVVDKDDGRTTVDPGEELTYTIRVTNAGEGDAHAIEVSDELPPELEFMSASEEAAYAEPGLVTWPTFDLAAGESREVTVTARVHEDVAAGTVVHNVAVAPHPDDPNPEDNTDDDRDDVDPVPRVEVPTPDDDPPASWLPRTGLEVASVTAIGLGLMAVGLAIRWWGRARPS